MRNRVSRFGCLVTFVGIAAVTGLHAQTASAQATAVQTASRDAPAVQQTPLTPAVLTPVPRVIWFSGAFRPADKRPVAAVETVTVAVYREREGGDAVWQETQRVSMEPDGRYSLLMGSTLSNGLPLDVFTSGEPRWIGITLHRPGEAEQPRVHLASVPYALKAADTETLGGKPASAYLLAEQKTPHASKNSADAASPLTAGNPGYIGVFVDGANLGNSALYQSGVAIGLGTTVPRDTLHVAFNDGGGGFTGYAVQNLSGASNAYSGMLFYDQTGATAQFQGFNNTTHEYRINNVASNGTINFMIGSSSKLKVANNGFIGIGTATPGVPLDVVGAGFTSNPGTVSYFTAGNTALVASSNAGWNASIRANSGIVAGDGYLTTSDARIKNIQGRSDSTADLSTLLGIEVTDFLYKDVVEKGIRPHKRVIAQQVEKVYPQAVRNTTDVVPDIYQKALINNGWIELATDLKAGDRVHLITENGHRAAHEVLEVEHDKFRTDFAEDAGQVFVYGREVKDFRVVDYEAIAMLNVSATQELNRRLEAQAEQIRRQTTRLTELEQQHQAQAGRITDLEQQASEIARMWQQMADMQAAVRTAGRPDSTRLATAK